MRSLIYYEMKKAFLRWPLLVVMIVFSIINLVKISSLYHSEALLTMDASMESAWEELYEEYQGQITTQKAQSCVNLYQQLDDALADRTINLFTEDSLTGNLRLDWFLIKKGIYEPMKYLYTYHSMAEEITKRAEENEILFDEVGNSYESRKNHTIGLLYRGRSVESFYAVSGYQFYFYYDFSVILTTLVVLYGLSQVFSRDKECAMDLLLLTNKKGGKTTIWAKIIASSLFLIFASLWFSLVDYVGFSFTFHMGKAGTLPIYAVESLATASVNMNLNQYLLVCLLSRILGFWVFGMIFLLICELSSNALISFVGSSILFLGAVLAGINWSYSENTALKVWNPYSLLTNRILFGKTEFVNVLGVPVLSWMAAIIFAVFMGGAALLLVLRFGRKSRFRREKLR